MKIKIITTGGTIDKIYFDKKDTYQVGHSPIDAVLQEARVNVDYEIISLFKKDSLDLTDEDRQTILMTVQQQKEKNIIITHGTDTMIKTAQLLKQITDKVIVLTGSLTPARFRESDAIYNIGSAMTAVQTLSEGVYITMNGQIFDPDNVKKNVELNRFQS